MIRSILRVLFGLFLALLVAGLVQVLFVVPPTDIIAADSQTRLDRLGDIGALSLLTATHSSVFALPFALLAVALAEWLALRGWLYYVTVGIGVALLGFYVQYSSEAGGASIFNNYALRAFVATGLVAGFVYWLVAGRRAGGSARDAVG